MNVQIEESWKAHLEPEFEKDYFRTLTDFVKSEYSQYQIFPPGKLIFNAFNLCPFDKVKVVIIGQDPYHGPGQAHGLCFSVNDGVPFPPSLVNIFKEIKADIGTDAPATGNLTQCPILAVQSTEPLKLLECSGFNPSANFISTPSPPTAVTCKSSSYACGARKPVDQVKRA